MLNTKYKLSLAILAVLFVTTTASFAAPQIDFWHNDIALQIDSHSKANLDASKFLESDCDGLAWLVREFSRSHQGQLITMSVDYHLLGAPELTQIGVGGNTSIIPDNNGSGLALAYQDSGKLPAPLFVSAKEDIQPRK